jgi:transposase
MKADVSTTCFDLIVSLDRSDKTVAVAVLDASSGGFLDERDLSSAPEAMEAWWHDLRGAHPGARIAVAFEQPAPNLLAFFAARGPCVIYALNPSATFSYRNALTVSHARNDQSDARDQARFVAHAHLKLRAWTPPPAQIEQLERLTQNRRKLVNQRTALTNRLQATLKRYYPQALALLHEHYWRPMNLDFLRRWPQPTKLRRSSLSSLRAFYRKHHSRSEQRWQDRLAVIQAMVPLGEANPADELEVLVMVDQIEVFNKGIATHDGAIATLFAAQGEAAARVAALPGAGPIFAPRLYTALVRHMPNCDGPEALAAAVGIAPVTDQSGRMRKVYRRLRCDTFTRQSFVEWVKESWKHSVWAEAFYRQREAKGHGFHATMRALAYKWIRILWRCWQDGVAYDEPKYLAQLKAKGSSLVPPELELNAATN